MRVLLFGRMPFMSILTSLCLMTSPMHALAAEFAPEFYRLDPNGDGRVDLTDAISLLQFLFLKAEPGLDCADSADGNDDGRVDLTDAISVLLYLFEGAIPPSPFPDCGQDPTEDSLDCLLFLPCGYTPARRSSLGIDFVYLPSGTFLMGSPNTERGRDRENSRSLRGPWALHAEELLHQVTLSCGFYFATTEVTQGQYLELMGDNPSIFNGMWGASDVFV